MNDPYTSLSCDEVSEKHYLLTEEYQPERFEVYDTYNESQEWTLGEDDMVYGQGLNGEVFIVSIERTPNPHRLMRHKYPDMDGMLYHVLKTTINYDFEESREKQDTSVEGTFTNKEDARERAWMTLRDNDVSREDCGQYSRLLGQYTQKIARIT